MEQLISIYQIAFIVCLVLGIISLAVMVLLFFKFDIRGIYDLRTGRGAKRTIEKMEEINAMTGKLRQETVDQTPVHLSPSQRIISPSKPKELKKQEKPAVKTIVETPPVNAEVIPKEPPSEPAGMAETSLLQGETPQVTSQHEDMPETTLLSAAPQATVAENEKPTKPELPGAFKIEKEIIWIHTKEII